MALAARYLHAGVGGLMHDWAGAAHEYDLGSSAPALVDALIAGVRAAPPTMEKPPARAADKVPAHGDA